MRRGFARAKFGTLFLREGSGCLPRRCDLQSPAHHVPMSRRLQLEPLIRPPPDVPPWGVSLRRKKQGVAQIADIQDEPSLTLSAILLLFRGQSNSLAIVERTRRPNAQGPR